MPAYAYKAVHETGRVMRGEMTAANENELLAALKENGLELIDAREKKARQGAALFAGKVPPRAIAGFCARMQDLLQSGVAFPDAMHDAIHAVDNEILSNALTQIARAISSGGGIAASFAACPRLFPPIVTATLAAGEASGAMDAVFGALAADIARQAQTQEKLRRALRYPLFLFIVAGSSVAFMLIAVVPKMIQFLDGLDAHLPWSTRALVAVSAATADYGGQAAILLCLGILTIFIARRLSPAILLRLDALLLRTPVIGPIIAKAALARFIHNFTLLFRNGCPTPDCLRQARATTGNAALEFMLGRAEQRVVEGSALSAALPSCLPGLFPPYAAGLLRTGERSGNIGKSLDDIATVFDREAQESTDALIGLLEPALTLSIGLVMIWTVMAVMGPLYGSLSVLGGRMQ
ncbi:MAG: type II secretion system F family protein [Alphaproteobacteria bacterium]|nr:type II secretion system F family protein [Alphaproteobacteria bacterium]